MAKKTKTITMAVSEEEYKKLSAAVLKRSLEENKILGMAEGLRKIIEDDSKGLLKSIFEE